MSEEISHPSDFNKTLDHLEAAIIDQPPAFTPVIDRFTPGLYIREIHIPAGTLGTSMVHKFEHPFALLKGRIRVTSENEGIVIYEAPYIGITKPGTRRALYAETDCVWVTFHVTEETDVEKIIAAVTDTSANPLLPTEHPAAFHCHHHGADSLNP